MLPCVMLDLALETLVRRATEADGAADLQRAREAFHACTGPFAPGEAWYEQRIRFFLDWYLVGWISEDASRPAERVAATEQERVIARALGRASRSLYRVLDIDAGQPRIEDRLGGGRFRITHDASTGSDPLRAGDLFDGYLVVLGERIHLTPGPLFHPAETHEPLATVVARARSEAWARAELLDGLLRMRMRLDRFTSMRARHIYRWEALGDRDILSAAWARGRA